MSITKELIVNSLRYFDSNREKYSNFIDKFKNYSIKLNDNDIEHSTITFYDDKFNELFKSRYEILATYYNNVNLMVWSWANPVLRKNLNYISKQTLFYGLNINPLNEDLFTKAELITSRFKITDDIQLEIHSAISSYISKQPFIYKLIFDPDITPIEQQKENIFVIPNKTTTTSRVYYLYILDLP